MTALHIVAGLLALVAGAVALHARKGGPLHRQSGSVFVYAMLFMSASGALMAVRHHQALNVAAGVLTFYLVTTALLAVRRPRRHAAWADTGALLLGVAGGIAAFRFGVEAASRPTGTINGMPAAPGFIFAAVALLATAGDLRLILGRALEGRRRLGRHLWRMCFALFIAAGSFFLGQAEVFPVRIRRSGLLPMPVLAVLATMFYWMWRVRARRLPSAA